MTFPILDGKVAVITGAAMGMGKEAAILFAEAKAKVVVADINEKLGNEVVDQIRASGGEATFIHTDVSDSAAVQAMVQHAVDTFGRLDVAVNNAAIQPDNDPLVDFDEAYWDRLMSVDLKGQALCCKYEIRQLLAQGGGGSIINISSVSGFRPQPHNVAYVAAKHGVIGLTKVAALEHGKDGIRVNAVARARSIRRCCRAPSTMRESTPRSSPPRCRCWAGSPPVARSPRRACGSPRTCRAMSRRPVSTWTRAIRIADGLQGRTRPLSTESDAVRQHQIGHLVQHLKRSKRLPRNLLFPEL